mgnify:CR=1 FL=1
MGSSAAVWLVLVVAIFAANLPFANERLFAVGPRHQPKGLGWRVLELVVLFGLTLGLGFLLESRLGQVTPQAWQFYVAFFFFFLTLAFPGFVWRYLRKHHG